MNIIKRLIEAVGKQKDSTESGCDMGNARSIKDRFTRTTPFCAHCLMVFPAHIGGVTELPTADAADIMRHTQQCPKNPLVKKLEAATEALRKVSCLIHSTPTESEIKRAYGISLDAWREATK